MKQIASIGLCLALAVSALATNAMAQTLANRPALDFTGAPSPTGEDPVFSRSVAARFAGVPLAQVLTDIRAQGFECASDYCTRTVMEDACANAWTIDIAADHTLSGRHSRLCMGAAEDE